MSFQHKGNGGRVELNKDFPTDSEFFTDPKIIYHDDQEVDHSHLWQGNHKPISST